MMRSPDHVLGVGFLAILSNGSINCAGYSAGLGGGQITKDKAFGIQDTANRALFVPVVGILPIASNGASMI